MYQYSGAGYITVSSRTQDRNTPSSRTHRTHGKADSTQNTELEEGYNVFILIVVTWIRQTCCIFFSPFAKQNQPEV